MDYIFYNACNFVNLNIRQIEQLKPEINSRMFFCLQQSISYFKKLSSPSKLNRFSNHYVFVLFHFILFLFIYFIAGMNIDCFGKMLISCRKETLQYSHDLSVYVCQSFDVISGAAAVDSRAVCSHCCWRREKNTSIISGQHQRKSLYRTDYFRRNHNTSYW